jgi:flagellar protein FliJ
MPSAAQLKFLLKRAQEESDSATQHLGQARKAFTSSNAKHALLARYREDYRAQLGATAAQGVDGDRLRNFQRFIANVTQAITQQQQEVERCKAVTQRAELAWRETQQRLQSYRTLAERDASRARIAEERKQQKQSDEFCNQSFLRLAGKS